MKIFEILGTIGTAIMNHLEKGVAEQRAIEAKLEEYDDEKLKKIVLGDPAGFFSGPTPAEKGAASKILRSRGYTEGDYLQWKLEKQAKSKKSE